MSDSGTVDFLITKNFRAGSLVAYWALKSRIIRTCAIAFHKWVRFAVVSNAVATLEKQIANGTPAKSPPEHISLDLHSGSKSLDTAVRADVCEAPVIPVSGGEENEEEDVMSEEMERLRRSNRGNRSRRAGVSIPLAIPALKEESIVDESTAVDTSGKPEMPSASVADGNKITVDNVATPNNTLEKTVAAARALSNRANLLSVDTEAIAASVGRSLKSAANAAGASASSRSKEEKKLDAFAAAVHDAIIDGKRNLLLSLARDIISGAGITTSSLSLLSHSMALEEMDSYTKVAAPGTQSGPGSGASRRQSVGSRPYLQNSYSRPREAFNGTGNDPDPSHSAVNVAAETARLPFAEDRGRDRDRDNCFDLERGRAEGTKPSSVQRRSSSATPATRTLSADIGGDFASQRRRSNSVSPARRRWRKKQQEEAAAVAALSVRRAIQHPHSAQYQRIQLIRQMKAQTEAELQKANAEREDVRGKEVRRRNSSAGRRSSMGSSSNYDEPYNLSIDRIGGGGSVTRNSDHGHGGSVYAFGSSTHSDKNVANAPVSAVRNDVIYNSGRYHHNNAVMSSGYGTVTAMSHCVTVDRQRDRTLAGLNERSRSATGTGAARHSNMNTSSVIQTAASSQCTHNSTGRRTTTASYMQPTHASDKRIAEAIKERTLCPSSAQQGQSQQSWFSAKGLSRSGSNNSLMSKLTDSVDSNGKGSNRGSPNALAAEYRYQPSGKAVLQTGRNKLHQERQAQGVLPLRTDKPPPGMERAQWMLMMGINPHYANNFKRGR